MACRTLTQVLSRRRLNGEASCGPVWRIHQSAGGSAEEEAALKYRGDVPPLWSGMEDGQQTRADSAGVYRDGCAHNGGS
jgi:hypothetical protein